MDKHSFPNGKRLVRDTLKPDDNLHYEQYADGTVKCIEDEIPFDVPNNWEWCRLQTICAKEIKRGKAPKYEEKSSVIVFAQKCNTKSGFIDISKAKFLAQNTLKKYADEDFLYYNDIIINSTGTGTLGRVGIYKKEDDIYNIKIVPDSHITTVRTIPSEINAQYIYYFLKFNQLYFENSGVGSTNQKELKPEVISTFLIAIPPLNEQNAIIDKVNMVNKHLSNLDNEKEQLKELISSTKSKILDLAIRGKLVPQDPNDEPASKLLKRINSKAEITCDTSQYGKLPKGWCETTLGNTIVIKSGDAIKVRDNRIGKYPIYGGNGITGYNESYNVDGINIIIGRVGFYCGSVHYVNNKIWVTDNAFVTKIMGNVYTPKFLYYLLQQYDLKQYSNSTAQPVISGKTVYPINVMLPPLSEQYRIVARIEELFAQLDKIESSLQA